jgi:SAM-dependent methyltransferase
MQTPGAGLAEPGELDVTATATTATTAETAATAATVEAAARASPRPADGTGGGDARTSFRFYDNRQKYLMFVNTCTEKWVVAERVERELQSIHPKPPAIRVFDAGVGDGTVLTRVLRSMHLRYPTLPFYVVAKEISLEDVRLTLDKTPDRFFEHPSTVLVITNLYYREAPWLNPQSVTAATTMNWHEVALTGTTAREFERQITSLQPLLAENWGTVVNKATGALGYERPAVLVIYREDHRFLLNSVIPRRGATRADYDLVIASQPYRLRAPLEFKASRVLAPLAKALGPDGRLLVVQSHGGDPGQEILQGVWPGENPFTHDRHQVLKAVKEVLGPAARSYNFNANPEERALFRHEMHTLPAEIEGSIGTSTLLAAWNAAVYVGQIEDARLEQALASSRYLEVTREVLRRHGGLWFCDEAFGISRRRSF